MACDPVNFSQFVVDLRSRHLSYWSQLTAPDPRVNDSKWLAYHQWHTLPVREAHAIHPIQCLIFLISFFATLPDSGCGFPLFELNRLFGPITLLQSVIPVVPMAYKMKNMCCSDVSIPRSALSVKSMPHFF
eukprot:1157799-Pelagomonas_calceolata.AAC.13